MKMLTLFSYIQPFQMQALLAVSVEPYTEI